MAFVIEVVPDEAKKQLDPKVFWNPLTQQPSFLLHSKTQKWVIDRERDVFLTRLGGGKPWEGGEAPWPKEFMALCWRGEVIKFIARIDRKAPEMVSRWLVDPILLPDSLESQRDAILQLIREGLEAMGNPRCGREHYSEIEVFFN